MPLGSQGLRLTQPLRSALPGGLKNNGCNPSPRGGEQPRQPELMGLTKGTSDTDLGVDYRDQAGRAGRGLRTGDWWV